MILFCNKIERISLKKNPVITVFLFPSWASNSSCASLQPAQCLAARTLELLTKNASWIPPQLTFRKSPKLRSKQTCESQNVLPGLLPRAALGYNTAVVVGLHRL